MDVVIDFYDDFIDVFVVGVKCNKRFVFFYFVVDFFVEYDVDS